MQCLLCGHYLRFWFYKQLPSLKFISELEVTFKSYGYTYIVHEKQEKYSQMLATFNTDSYRTSLLKLMKFWKKMS